MGTNEIRDQAREAVKMFTDTNAFLKALDASADYAFVVDQRWTDADLEADGERYFAGLDEPIAA